MKVLNCLPNHAPALPEGQSGSSNASHPMPSADSKLAGLRNLKISDKKDDDLINSKEMTQLERYRKQQELLRIETQRQMDNRPDLTLNDLHNGYDFKAVSHVLHGLTRIQPFTKVENLQNLLLPEWIVSIGANFEAPRLKGLYFDKSAKHLPYDAKLEVAAANRRREEERIDRALGGDAALRRMLARPLISRGRTAGAFLSFGDRFNAVSLETLDLRDQVQFRSFGKEFNAPNLVSLNLSGAIDFRRFPDDMRLPSLITLDLSGAKNFEGFPAGFLEGMPNLRHLTLSGTKVTVGDLPPAILRNERGIEIDLLPNVAARGAGGRQTTHRREVHASASESAKRLTDLFPNVDVRVELAELTNRVHQLSDEEVPSGLDLTKTLAELLDEVDGPLDQQSGTRVNGLPADHPFRRYFRSSVNTAKRVLDGEGFPQGDYIDPRSEISVETFFATGWHAAKLSEQRRPGVTDDTVLDIFVKIIHEIKREYNHNEITHVDDGSPQDKLTCGGGAFNKSAEYMSMILELVEQRAVDISTIAGKVDKFVVNYVSDLINSGMATEADFDKPDKDGHIFCSKHFAKRLEESDAIDRLMEGFAASEGEKSQIKGFWDYQLVSTDFSTILKNREEPASS